MKIRKIIGAGLGLAMMSLTAKATPLYWDTNGTADGSGAATGSWDGVSTLFNTDSTGGAGGTLQAVTASTDDLYFSAGTIGTAGTITVSGSQAANSLTFNQAGLVFSGGTIGMNTTGNAVITVNQSASMNLLNVSYFSNFVVASGQTLTLSSNSTAANSNNFFLNGTNGITGGGTVKITYGTFTTQANPIVANGSTTSGGLWLSGTGAVLTVAGGMQIGRSTPGGLVTVDNGGFLNVVGSGQVNVGRGSTTSFGRLLINGGTVSIAYTTKVGLMVGRDSGNGILDLQAGALNIASALSIAQASSSQGTVNISGGVATANTVQFGSASDNLVSSGSAGSAVSGTGRLNMTGGSLYVGSGGIINLGSGSAAYFITLGSGTLGASADWTSALNITSNGVHINAADANGNAHAITLGGAVSGSGFTKTGAGTVLLNGANNLSGSVVISAGVLQVGSTGSLTVGNLDFVLSGSTNGELTTLSGGTGSVSGISIDISNAAAAGSWTLYDANTAAWLSSVSSVTGWQSAGGGLWTNGNYSFNLATGVVSAVPEPSTWLLMGVGLVALVVSSLRRRRV